MRATQRSLYVKQIAIIGELGIQLDSSVLTEMSKDGASVRSEGKEKER